MSQISVLTCRQLDSPCLELRVSVSVLCSVPIQQSAPLYLSLSAPNNRQLHTRDTAVLYIDVGGCDSSYGSKVSEHREDF